MKYDRNKIDINDVPEILGDEFGDYVIDGLIAEDKADISQYIHLIYSAVASNDNCELGRVISKQLKPYLIDAARNWIDEQ